MSKRSSIFRRKWRDPNSGEMRESDFWFLYWRDAAGRPHTRRTSPPTANEAAASRQLARIVAGVEEPGSISVAEILEGYEAHLRANAVTTWRNCGSRLRAMVDRWGRLRAGLLTTSEVDRFALALKAEGLSDSTVGGHLTLLKAAFNRARRSQLLGDHPLCRLEITYQAAIRRVVWDDDEIERLLPALIPWARQVVGVLLETGLRIGDALALRWDQIRGDVLKLHQEKGRRRRDAGFHETVLSTTALAVLATIPRSSSPFLFPAEATVSAKPHVSTGHKMKRNFVRAFDAACRAAGVEGKTVHDIRRSFAQRLKRAGWEESMIAALLGQKSTRMVSTRYTETELDILRRAVNGKAAPPRQKRARSPRKAAPPSAPAS